MISPALYSPNEVLRSVAKRARTRRLSQNLTQDGLAARAGVSLGTLKLFERTGKASFETVLKIAFALGAEKEFDLLFPDQEITRIEDVIEPTPRQRGTRK